jgi:hypothetical protein
MYAQNRKIGKPTNLDKGNNKITELRKILQRESKTSIQTKSDNNRITVKTVMTMIWYRHF